MKMETEYLVHTFSLLRPQHFSSESSRVLEDSLIEIELYFFIRKVEELFSQHLHFWCNFSFRFRIGAEPLAISRRALALEAASTF